MKIIDWIWFDKKGEREEFKKLMESCNNADIAARRLMDSPWDLQYMEGLKAFEVYQKHIKK